MTRRKIAKLLGLNTKTFAEFWEYTTAHKYIEGNDTDGYELHLPVKFGHIQENDSNGKVIGHQSRQVRKMYTGSFCNLYHKGKVICEPTKTYPDGLRPLTPRDHFRIGKILQLVPYIHIGQKTSTNRLCRNPKSVDNIEDLTEADIARIVGIDARHRKRDIAELCKVVFPIPIGETGEELGELQYVLLRTVNVEGHITYIMNPRLFYFGNIDDRLKVQSKYSFTFSNEKSRSSIF